MHGHTVVSYPSDELSIRSLVDVEELTMIDAFSTFDQVVLVSSHFSKWDILTLQDLERGELSKVLVVSMGLNPRPFHGSFFLLKPSMRRER